MALDAIQATNYRGKTITPIQLKENKTPEELNESKAKKGETQVNYFQQLLAKTSVFENKSNPISKPATDLSSALAGTTTVKTAEVKQQADKNNTTNFITGHGNSGKQVLASGLSETSKDDGMNRNKKEQGNTYSIAHKTQRELFIERFGNNKDSIFAA